MVQWGLTTPAASQSVPRMSGNRARRAGHSGSPRTLRWSAGDGCSPRRTRGRRGCWRCPSGVREARRRDPQAEGRAARPAAAAADWETGSPRAPPGRSQAVPPTPRTFAAATPGPSMAACHSVTEVEADHAAVARLHRLAFGGDAEARLVDALRRSDTVAVSLVAQSDDAVIVGHVLLSRLVSPPGALGLAPLAGAAGLPPAAWRRLGAGACRAGARAGGRLGRRLRAGRPGLLRPLRLQRRGGAGLGAARARAKGAGRCCSATPRPSGPHGRDATLAMAGAVVLADGLVAEHSGGGP